MTELLKLFSPLTSYKVEVFMKAAEIIEQENFKNFHARAVTPEGRNRQLSAIAIPLLQNFEQLSLLLLKKEHFVCEVEKPVEPITDRDVFVEQAGGIQHEMITDAMFTEHHTKKIRWYEKEAAYQSALSHLLFEGFNKKYPFGENSVSNTEGNTSTVVIYFEQKSVTLLLGYERTFIDLGANPTIKDLCYHLDKYNETASSKISITPTESLVKRIVGCQ